MNDRISAITEAHPYVWERESVDWPAFNCPENKLFSFLKDLKENHGYDFLADLTAIDHFEGSPRFEVVYHLYSLERHVYLRVACPCRGDNDPLCQSVVSLWGTADWHERETFDMFGIVFEGHPDLRRILMWDGYPYYPLRKEFPLAGRDVDFPSEDLAEATGTHVKPSPMMGGPFHASQIGPMSKREPRADDESWTESRERPGMSDDGESDDPRNLKRTNL